MRSDTERGKTFAGGIALDANCRIDIESIAEYHLFASWINVQRPILADNQVEFLVIVATVYPQTYWHSLPKN